VFRKRKKKSSDNAEQIRELLKKPKNHIFGFICSLDVHMHAKVLATKLNVDLGILAEHCLHLGLMDTAAASEDPDEVELLREHLQGEHAIQHLAESVGKYDADAAGYIREGQIRRYRKEKALRDLVELSARYNLDPRLIKEIVLSELRRQAAFAHPRTAQETVRQEITGGQDRTNNT
jgi:hypothetical protein